MNLILKKNIVFAGFLLLATSLILLSCGNDTETTVVKEKKDYSDSAAIVGGDTTTAAAGSAVKKRKGKASGALSADNSGKIEKDKDGIYSKAEKMPEYPGGSTALSAFVENNISYPDAAIDQNTEGTVTVSFVVDEKGKVVNPVATGKSAGHGLDEEAVKVIKQMPDWKPGTVKGKAVKTRLTLPVTFKLADA